jgi:hypothetical protein
MVRWSDVVVGDYNYYFDHLCYYSQHAWSRTGTAII